LEDFDSYFTLEAMFPVSPSFNEEIKDEESSDLIRSAFTTIPSCVDVVEIVVAEVSPLLGAPNVSVVVLSLSPMFDSFKLSLSSP